MRSSLIELIDIAGNPIAHFQSQQIDGITKYYNGKLIAIHDKGLSQLRSTQTQHSHNNDSHTQPGHNLRFVIANNQQQKQSILAIQPIKCYLRDQDMNAKIIYINPYNSVGWLRNKLERERNCRVNLVINQKDLNIDSESLIKYIFEDAIIHVIETSNKNAGSYSTKNNQQIFTLYSKQPGAESKVFKIQGVYPSLKISQLSQNIQNLTKIPNQCLYLVHGGKILDKGKLIGDYFIRENGCVYAVDARKYLKKVSMDQYKRRLGQVRKVRECNRPVMAKVFQQNQIQSLNQKYLVYNKSSKPQPLKSISKPSQTYHTYHKRGTLIQNLQDNNQYFPSSQMNIDSPQFTQFQNYGKKIQQRMQQSPHVKRIDSSLEHGRIVTNQSNVYQDQSGNFHEHNYQKSVYRNGYKTVDTNITQDADGNVIKIQKDIVNLKKNQVTGQVTKIITDIVEDVEEDKKIVIKKEEVRDRDGNIIKYQTKKYTEDVGPSMSSSHSSRINNYQQYQQGSSQVVSTRNPQTSQQKLVQLDSHGNIRTLQTQLIQSGDKVIFVNKDQLQDSDGNLLTSKTGVIQITNDDQGNTHKHKSQILQTQSKVTVIQTNQILDSSGRQLGKQKDIIQIKQQPSGDIIKKQTDILEQDGQATVVTKQILEDSDGNILQTSTKVVQYRQNDDGNIEVNEEISVQKIVDVGVDGGQVGLVGGDFQKEINQVQDEQGNLMRTQRQYMKDQHGQAQLVTTYTLQKPDGEIVEQKTQTITIQEQQQNSQPKVLRHTTNYSLVDDDDRNKIILQQSTSKQALDGSIIKSDKQKIQIESYQDGTRRTSKTQVVEQGGNKVIYIKNQLQDEETGRLISKTSDVYELQAVQVGPRNAIKDVEGDGEEEAGSYIATVQKSSLNRTYNVNDDGNLVVTESETRRDQGIQNVTKRQSVFNQQGQIIHKITEIAEDETLPTGQTRYTVADIVEQGNLTTVIQTKTYVDPEGKSVRTQTGTMQIQKLHDGLTRKQKETVVEQEGIKVKVHKQAFEDQEGNLLEQQITTTELAGDTKDAPIVSSSTFKRKVEQIQQDEQGNYLLHQREIDHHADGTQTVTESQVVRNDKNQLIKATTDVTKTKDLEDGNLQKYLVNIVEKPGKVTIAESKSIENADGEKLTGEVSSLTLTQGQNDQIIQQQTLVTMDNFQKKIVQKIIVQDSEGNIVSQQGKSKVIFTDQDGNQQQREQKSYQAVLQKSENANESDKFQQIQKQVKLDQQGNTITLEKKIVETADQGSTIVQTYTIQNIDGQIIGMNTRIFNVVDEDDHSISREQNQTLTADKLIKNQIIKISDAEGNILGQNQRRVQVVQQQGHIKTKEVNIQRKDGQTLVGMVDLIHDQDGNLIDRSSSSVRIRDTEQAVRQKAQKVAQAELLGQIISSDSKVYSDQQGNKLTLNSQTINNQGSIIKIQTKTIENQQGELINSKTEITQTNLLSGSFGNLSGSSGPRTTTINQQGGYVQVIQISNDGNGNGNGHGMMGDNDVNMLESITTTVAYPNNKNNINNNNNNGNQLSDLLGFNDEAIGSSNAGQKIQMKVTNSIYNSGNLSQSQTRPLQFQQIQAQISQAQAQQLLQNLPTQPQHLTSSMTVQSSTSSQSQTQQQPSNRYQVTDLLGQELDTSNTSSNHNNNNLLISAQISTPTNNNMYKNTLLQQQDYIMPEQFDIIAIDKKRNQYKLKVRYDEIIDEVRKKLCVQKGLDEDYRIHFYKNGDELNQYDMISELDIGNGDALYFTEEGDE